MNVKQVSGRSRLRKISAIVSAAKQGFSLPGHERHNVESCFCQIDLSIVGCEQNRLAVWKNLRESMCLLAFLGVKLSQRLRGSAVLGDACQAAPAHAEDDVSILTPGSTDRVRSRAEHHRGATSRRNLLEASVREERDPFTIRRKKGIPGALGSRQRRGFGLVECADRELLLSS